MHILFDKYIYYLQTHNKSLNISLIDNNIIIEKKKNIIYLLNPLLFNQ
jgi:hypothetical protein